MQANDNALPGWNATDDETPVPIRANGNAVEKEVKTATGPAHDIGTSDLGHIRIEGSGEVKPTQRGMTLSAVLGVTLAIGGVVAYLGVGNFSLRGDVTGGASIMLTITQDGQFDPTSINVHPGESVTIENKNPDPQVLKPKNARDLFPVQVVFDQPYTFTVPADAAGQYIYYSETLPDDRTVTFNVTAAAAASSESSVAAPVDIPPPPASSDGTMSIPLPFGGGSVDVPAPNPPPAPATSVNVDSTPHSGDTATISLGGSSSSSSESVSNTGIPTNPYTVANAPKNIPTTIASSAASENLHSGAPLLVQNIRSPKRTPDSGTGGMMLLFIPALLGVIALSRKLSVV